RLRHVEVDGVDVTAEVRVPAVDRAVSEVARVGQLRAALLQRQREIARGGGIIMAGRDIGTVVLPDADVKVFLDASAEERARRRTRQRHLDPQGAEARSILEELRRRDAIDSGRTVAPLRIPSDAVVIQTDGNQFNETVRAVVAVVHSAERAHHDAAVSAAAPAESEGTSRAPARQDPATLDTPTPTPALSEPDQPPEVGVGSVADLVGPPTGGSRGLVAALQTQDELTAFGRSCSAFGRLLARATARIRVEGLDDLPPEVFQGPLIVASNHASNADPILIAAWVTPALGRPVHWMAKAEALRWPIAGRVMLANGAFGIRRGAADVEAFRAARRILDIQAVLGLFPEGTRSPDGSLQEVKEGATLLALRTGALILPVGIGGSHRLWPKGGGLHPGARVVLRVGRPFSLGESPHGSDHRKVMKAATQLLMRHIAELLPPSQRGAYAEVVARRT
ncbi:MAG: (d)CMP kinase, partial [Candidatus Limnocylindrales bacterium]